MNKLILLTVISLKNAYNVSKITRTRPGEKVRMAVMLVLIVFSFMSVALSFGTYAALAAQPLKEVGLLDMLLMLAVVMGFVLCLFFSMFSAQGMIFKSRDTELLLSMPIPAWNIFLSRAVGVYIGNFLISLLIYVPWYAVYCYYAGGVKNPAFMLLGIAAANLIPTAIAIVFAYILSWITAKFKGKSFVTIVVSLGLLLAYMYFVQQMPKLLAKLTAEGLGFMAALGRVYPPSMWFRMAVSEGNVYAMLVLALSALLFFAVVAAPVGMSFRKIIATLAERHRRKGYTQAQIRGKSSPFIAMLKKDISRYFGSPMYVMNTAIGPLLMLIVSISLIFGGTGVLASILEMPGIESYISRAVIVLLCAASVLTCTTAPSLSLEAKTLWILKGSPVNTFDIFKSKIALNVLVSSPLLIFSAVIFSITVEFTPAEFAAAVILPFLLTLVIAASGLIINLMYPKLDWTNETVVIKQSMSVILTMLAGAAFVAIPVFLYLKLLISMLAFERAVILYALLLVSIYIVLLRILKGYGTRLFEKF